MKPSSAIIFAATLVSFGLVFKTEAVKIKLHADYPLMDEASNQDDPEALAKKSGCLKCHSTTKNVVGPAYRDIAARYKDDPRARATLIKTVKKGGKGNWTEVTAGVPMPAHSPRLTDAEIRRLVDWVLRQ